MSFAYTLAHRYSEAYSSPEPPLLARIRQETMAHVPGAQMISGHLQGRVLAAISRMLRPKKILEIGTYTGYATLCLLEGLVKEGLLYTVDNNVRLAEQVKGYFAAAGEKERIRYYIGQATEVIPAFEELFDLIFIDADKRNYLVYYEMALSKLNQGGFLLIDNLFWKGKVFETLGTDKVDLVEMDRKTEAIVAFNNMVRRDERVAHVLLPIRDGLMLVWKNETLD